MPQKLLGLSGPLAGIEYELSNGELIIGREASSGIVVPDTALSRRHCTIKSAGDRCTVFDVGSRNGILVNGVPVRQQDLKNGDRLEIGRSELVFIDTLDDGEAVREAAVWVDCHPGETTVALDVSVFDASKSRQDPEEELAILLSLSTSMVAAEGLEALSGQLLDAALKLTGADWAALTPADESRVSIAFAEEGDLSLQPVLSRTAIMQATHERKALLWSRVADEAASVNTRSLVGSGAQSVAVAPIAYADRVLGALYVATVGHGPLTTRELRFVSSLAALAAAPLDHLQRYEQLRAQHEGLQRRAGFHDIIGDSPAMQQVYRAIEKCAGTDSNVLVLGESGTGKELVANAIHRASSRASGPLIAVNCAAISETLLESELFGHEKGAFTGAVAARRGRIEEANNGTLFLDEIGELALPLQAKLLRALQQREFTRVGGNRAIKVDFRLIAATNRDLDEARKAKMFREDLYYRLNVITIPMPPLRERREDIKLLSSFFLGRTNERCKRRIAGFSTSVQRLLDRYDWPGNVRELENAIERAVVMSSGDVVVPEDLPDSILDAGKVGGQAGSELLGKYHEEVFEFKRRLILATLDKANGSFTDAARMLGLQVTYLHRLARNLDARNGRE